MLMRLFRIIIKIILFAIIPILMCVLFIESIIVGYQKEIFLYSDLLNSIPHLTLWLIGVGIVSLGFFVIIFRVMKIRLFIFSCIIWSIVLMIAYSIYSQSIKGLVEIPDSVFAFSGVDIHNIPKLTPELCSEMKKLTQDLRSTSQLLFFSTGSEESIWRGLNEKNPEKSEFINYLLFLNEKLFSERIYHNDFLSATSIDDKIGIESGRVTKITLLRRFPQEKQDEYTLAKNNRDKRERDMLNNWKQYLSTLSGSVNHGELVSLVYSSDDLKKIERLIEIINTSNLGEFGYCMKENPQNLADEIIPIMSSDFSIERILLQYALIEASIGETEKVNKIMILIVDNLLLKEKQSHTLVGAMMSIAMKGIFYESLDILKYIGYPEDLLNGIYTKIRGFDENIMMLNNYRGEYYLASHLLMNTGTSLQKLYIPVLLDGEESAKILKNYYSSAMNMIDTSFPKGKYSDIGNIADDDTIWPNSASPHKEYTLRNPLGRRLLNFFLPSINSYYKRFLLAEIEKNTILYPLTK